MKTGKKGSAMVEATIVVPVVILTVLAIIYIATALYTSVEENTILHRSGLKSEEGVEMIGNFIRQVDFVKGLIN